jgi:hypothetical protein
MKQNEKKKVKYYVITESIRKSSEKTIFIIEAADMKDFTQKFIENFNLMNFHQNGFYIYKHINNFDGEDGSDLDVAISNEYFDFFKDYEPSDLITDINLFEFFKNNNDLDCIYTCKIAKKMIK